MLQDTHVPGKVTHKVHEAKADLVGSANSRGGKGFQGAHGHRSPLHDLLEQAIVVKAALTLRTNLGHYLHSLQHTAHIQYTSISDEYWHMLQTAERGTAGCLRKAVHED